MFLAALFSYFALMVVVGVAANARDRSGVEWFIFALFLSPLLAGLLLLALTKPNHPFTPDGLLSGVPYRLRKDNTIDAMLSGGLVRFRSMEQFLAATEGKTLSAG
jgi:hypothetical protein